MYTRIKNELSGIKLPYQAKIKSSGRIKESIFSYHVVSENLKIELRSIRKIFFKEIVLKSKRLHFHKPKSSAFFWPYISPKAKIELHNSTFLSFSFFPLNLKFYMPARIGEESVHCELFCYCSYDTSFNLCIRILCWNALILLFFQFL